MMKRIMIPGTAAVALAASAFFAPEAAAQRGERRGDRAAERAADQRFDRERRDDRIAERAIDQVFDRDRRVGRADLDVEFGHDRARPFFAHHGGRAYGGRLRRRQAVRMCRRAIAREAYYIGFRDVDFDGVRARRVGPYGFDVLVDAEFEGRRREFDRFVTCSVRGGTVRFLDGVPRPGRRHRGLHRHSGAHYKPYVSSGVTVSFSKSW